MKRSAAASVAAYFNASQIMGLKDVTGDGVYNGVVALLNRIMTPYADSEALGVVENPQYLPSGNGHLVSILLQSRGNTPLFFDVHAPIAASYDHCGSIPRRVLVMFRVDEDGTTLENEDSVEVHVFPRTMVSTEAKRQRLVRTKSFRERIGSMLWGGKEDAAPADDPESLIRSHRAEMRTWVVKKGVVGDACILEEVATKTAAVVCAALRACNTTWRIEKIETLGRNNPALPNGWLAQPHPCVALHICAQEGYPMPTFDAVVIDHAMALLKEEGVSTRVAVDVRKSSDGLRFLIAIL